MNNILFRVSGDEETEVQPSNSVTRLSSDGNY